MKKLIVLTGAGMSAESGLSTFRSSNGLWENHRVEDVATPEGWYRNPELVLDFYNGLRKTLIKSEPNAGHKKLIEPAIELVSEADIFVIIGTSLNVYPAAGLLNYVRANVPIYLIDPNDVHDPSGRVSHFIRKGASEGMRELIEILKK